MSDETFDLCPPQALPAEQLLEIFRQLIADGSWQRYSGPHGTALQQLLLHRHQRQHCHLCCSGTAAMELALRAAGVEAGTEVILSAYDFKSNLINILMLGARPVLVDTVPDLPVLDPVAVEAAISPSTRAVIASHLHGLAAPLSALSEIAGRHRITIIEDACQNPGACLAGQPAGARGDLAILSFGGSKLLTAGRGGAVLTDNPQFAQRITLHTQRGNDAWPLSELQAAVLLPQLQQLDQQNRHRAAAVRQLQAAFADSPAISLLLSPEFCSTPVNPDGIATAAFYKVALLLHAGRIARDELSAACIRKGIPLHPGFTALHTIHAKSRFRTSGSLTNATRLAEQLLVLHHSALLQPGAELRQMADHIRTLAELRHSATW
jgi:dTDP-4-amino-4,6-dideoxygalactose transaminase